MKIKIAVLVASLLLPIGLMILITFNDIVKLISSCT